MIIETIIVGIIVAACFFKAAWDFWKSAKGKTSHCESGECSGACKAVQAMHGIKKLKSAEELKAEK